jgi:hypothetical protein
MTEPTRGPKDIWDKLDVIVKGTAAVLVSAAIAFYGIYSEDQRSSEAEKNRRAQAIIQALGNRESMVADMRAKMFGTLIQHYFRGQDEKSQIIILELIALNFQDDFQLKPLFRDLDVSLRANSQDKQALKRTAQSIISREIDRLVGNGGNVCTLDLTLHQSSQADCAPVSLQLLEVAEDRIRLAVTPGNSPEVEVTYFNMPFADNSTRGELTYALVLSEVASLEGRAKVQVVVFPRHYYSGENRLRLDQMIGELLLRDLSAR